MPSGVRTACWSSSVQQSSDDSLFIDLLPFIQRCIEEDERTKQKKITLGVCSELIPVAQKLLGKKYESYQIVALDFVRAVIKLWFLELRAISRSAGKTPELSMNLPEVYMGIAALCADVKVLQQRKGLVADKAKVVQELFGQL